MMNVLMWKALFLLPFLTLSSCQTPLSTEIKRNEKLYAEALEAILGVGIRSQAILDTSGSKNFIISPFSIAVSLGQLILGAQGEFRDDLYYLLSLPKSEEETHIERKPYTFKNNNVVYTLPYPRLLLQLGGLLTVLEENAINQSFKLSCSSAWFLNKDVKLKREFEQNLQIFRAEKYATDFKRDGLGSMNFINKWVADHTNQLIKNILKAPLPGSTSAIFLNAIHFRGDWETPFSDELNIIAPFRVSPERSVNVTYMRGFLESIPYAENKEGAVRMIGLPYKNGEVTMYIFLPTEENKNKFNLNKFVSTLKTTDIFEMIQSAKPKQVLVSLPKMQLSNTIDVLEPLKKFVVYKEKMKQQMNQNLSSNSVDLLEEKVKNFTTFNSTESHEILLTGAAETGPLKLSGMLQEMTLSVNEKGTEAAAVTLSVIDYIGGNKNFIIDRPFLFLIRHELTTAALFWGTISDPSLSS